MKGFRIIMATVISTVLHFFILTLLDTIPLISKEVPPQTQLYMVDLITVQPARAVPQEEREVTVEKKVDEVKKQEVKKKESTKEAAKKETIKKEEKKEQVVLADRGKEQEKKEKTEKGPPDAEEQRLAAVDRVRQNLAARGEGDSRTPEGSAAEIQQYPVMVENRVKGFWVIPDPFSARELKAVVVFAIDKKGEVVNLRFKQSSGSLPYDQSVRRAISKAAPFSPPPHVLLEEEFELTFQP